MNSSKLLVVLIILADSCAILRNDFMPILTMSEHYK